MKRPDKARWQAAAAEHERRTGMVANMQGLGWRCRRRSKVDGSPLEFTHGDRMATHWVCNRNQAGEWKICRRGIRRTVNGYGFPNTTQLVGPTFPGPVAAAIWLKVEISNGSVQLNL